MPNIESVPQVFHQPLDPYHHEFDNLPLKNIIFRQQIINNALDLNIKRVVDAAGTAGTLANRLSQSLDESGSLLSMAVDQALHNIAEHTDGFVIISGEPVNYVRMLESERDKLTLIADEATDFGIRFETIGISSTPVTFDSGILPFANSTTITWRLDDGDVKADMVFSADVAHRHVYDTEPEHATPLSPDFINYKTTTVSTVFVEGSLRVYINGLRISEYDSIYAPGALPTDEWTLIKVTPSPLTGTFSLSTAISSDDVILIDFDIALN